MDLEKQYDKIYRYCYFRLHDEQSAQDITQETFLRFYRQDLKPDHGRELPYLYTIPEICAWMNSAGNRLPASKRSGRKRTATNRKNGSIIWQYNPRCKSLGRRSRSCCFGGTEMRLPSPPSANLPEYRALPFTAGFQKP